MVGEASFSVRYSMDLCLGILAISGEATMTEWR